MRGRRMRCSFCGRKDSEVEKLVAGPMRLFRRVYICERCAAQTIQIMETHSGGDQPRREKPSVLRRILTWLGSDRLDMSCVSVR
jgi:ATP-dependent protease Clp ATPase subunit